MLAPGGRLLIVDFAPHELEFLREQYAHERLGFAGPVVGQWLSDFGLQVLGDARRWRRRDGGKKDKLTVSLWLAARPARRTARRTKRQHTWSAIS